MGIIAKTITRGFRTSFFRNQPVHQFYGHLQAVMKDIDASGQMGSLFARPETSASNTGEIEWSTELPGDAISFKDLTPEKQQEIAGSLSSSLERIRKYAQSKQDKTGIEKDYADYLKAVAMSPDLNQVFVVNNRPILVHWGFVCDSGDHPGQGIYAGWDEFIAQVQRKAAKEPEPEMPKRQAHNSNDQAAAAAAVFAASSAEAQTEPAPAEAEAEKSTAKISEKKDQNEIKPVAAAKESEKAPEKKPEKKPVNKDQDPNREKPLMALGLGIYKWIKWLAIVLAIIILLLLLLPKRNPLGGMMGMPGGGQMPSLTDMLGGLPSGGGGGGGGMPAGGSGQGGQKGAQTCPHCGHSIDQHSGQSQQPDSGN